MQNPFDTVGQMVEHIFPELKESKDEKHRKWILEYLYNGLQKADEQFKPQFMSALYWLKKQGEKKAKMIDVDKVIEWLDKMRICLTQSGASQNIIEQLKQDFGLQTKQGEQKPTDKIEPKFKVGDWFVNNKRKDVFLIKSITNGYCTLEDIKGNIISPCLPPCESDSHIWTIRDAKDGDVLVASDGSIFLFAGVVDCACKYYVALTTDNHVEINKEAKGGYWETSRAVHPATKEQRVLLFEKIKQEGYEWGQKEKKLIKMKEPKFKVGDWVVKRDGENFWNGNCVAQITNITDRGEHWFDSGSWLKAKDIRLWTINDANDGDVLVDSYSKDSIIILYKGIDKERSILAHCGWNGYNFSIKTNGLGYGRLDNTNYLPATKEQRDLLFSKMKQAGYEWDDEKKDLSKQTLQITPKFCVGQVITDDNGTWYKITNIKCLDDWHYELYDVGKANTHLELCSIIDEKFRENRFVGEIKKMMGD